MAASGSVCGFRRASPHRWLLRLAKRSGKADQRRQLRGKRLGACYTDF